MRNILDAAVELMPAPSERGPRAGVVPASGAERRASPVVQRAGVGFRVQDDRGPVRRAACRSSASCSGTLRGDTTVQNVGRGTPERLGTVNLLQGKQLVAVPELRAGDLGVVAKLKETRTSDTLADPAHPIQYPPIAFPEPAISFAIEPKSKGDEDKISTALARLMEEDPVLRVNRDARTHEMLVSGNGQVHVEVAIAKMKRKFGVEAVLRQPKVPYLETIKRKVPAVQGRHKKQTGGRGQFGDCWIEMEPLPRGAGFEFVDKIFGGSIPQNFRPAVEKGIRESAERGWLVRKPRRRFPGHADRRLVPRRRLVGNGVQDRGLAGVQGGHGAGAPDDPRADLRRRDHGARGVHGRDHGRPVVAARQAAGHGNPGTLPDHQGHRPARRDCSRTPRR